MKSRAAVAFAAGEPLQIVEIDVEPPKAGEVLVKITHTGVCHTDAYTLSGEDSEGVFPAVLGHEGVLIRESLVISEYLDDRFPARPMRPAEPITSVVSSEVMASSVLKRIARAL